MVLEMTSKANDETITSIISEYPKPLQKNTNDDVTRWERLYFGIFVERKVFPRNGTSTNLYFEQKMSLFKFSGTLTFNRTI